MMSVLSSSGDIPLGLAGNFIAFSSYILFIGIFISLFPVFELPKKPLLAFVIIHMLFIIGLVRDLSGLINHPSSYTFPTSNIQILLYTAEVIGYIVASITLVFLIPKVISRDRFFLTVVSISSFSILIGIPAYVIGDFSIFGVDITTYTALDPLRQYGIRIPALASIFADANAMSKIAAAGLLGSHYLHVQRQSKVYLLLLGLNICGLFLANSRMAIIAVIIAYSVYFVYRIFGKTTTIVYLGTSSVLGSIFFILIVLNIGTGSFVPTDGFAGRISLWKAAVESFLQHPAVGIGIHNVGEAISAYTGASSIAPQNSYLSIFVAGGVIGGVSYLLVITTSTFKYITKIESRADLLTICLLITFILIQFTDTSHPFGVNKNALIFGVTLGYVIDGVYNSRNN